jgi:hypothetical protein
MDAFWAALSRALESARANRERFSKGVERPKTDSVQTLFLGHFWAGCAAGLRLEFPGCERGTVLSVLRRLQRRVPCWLNARQALLFSAVGAANCRGA